jgi:hypothetical protein
VWKLDCNDVLSIILPKAQKQYAKKSKGFGKDPRIGVTISKKEIETLGTRIVG